MNKPPWWDEFVHNVRELIDAAEIDDLEEIAATMGDLAGSARVRIEEWYSKN